MAIESMHTRSAESSSYWLDREYYWSSVKSDIWISVADSVSVSQSFTNIK